MSRDLGKIYGIQYKWKRNKNDYIVELNWKLPPNLDETKTYIIQIQEFISEKYIANLINLPTKHEIYVRKDVYMLRFRIRNVTPPGYVGPWSNSVIISKNDIRRNKSDNKINDMMMKDKPRLNKSINDNNYGYNRNNNNNNNSNNNINDKNGKIDRLSHHFNHSMRTGIDILCLCIFIFIFESENGMCNVM